MSTVDPWKSSTDKLKADLSKRANWPFKHVVGDIPRSSSLDSWKADTEAKTQAIKAKPMTNYDEMEKHFGKAPF